MKRVSREDILSGNLIKTLLVLSVPVIINSFLQTMYNLTDTYWLGKLGTDQLAAINLVTPMQNLIINLGSGITVAGSVLISQYLGAKEDKGARSMANQIFACALIFSIVFMILCSGMAPLIVRWLGADPTQDLYRYAKTYLQLVMLDMPFLFTINMYTSIHQAEGDTLSPMLLNLMGICINLVADPALMVWLKLGAAGAALATVAAKAVPAIIAFIALQNRKHIVYLDLRKLKFEKDKLRQIVTVGVPSAIGGSVQQLGFLILSRSVFAYGKNSMAAYGIGNKVNGIISLPSTGIGSAVSIVVGQNYGANQMPRAQKAVRFSVVMVVGFLAIGGFILSRPMISTSIVKIFSDDQEVIEKAADFLSILALWCFANGVHDTANGFFKGMGKTTVPMVVDISRLWVFRFGTLYFCDLVLHMGVRSIWYAVVVSNGIAALILLIVYLSGVWKKWKPSVKKKEYK
jgi:putative MATE family efflux protein